MCSRFVPVLLPVLLLITDRSFAQEPPVSLDWWANRTAESCVSEETPDPNQIIRLQNCTTGFLEGTVILPATDTWNLAWYILADEDVSRDPTEFVDVFINGGFVERVFNDPAAFQHKIEHTIVGASFSYRFEFTSGNSTFHLHMKTFSGRAVAGEPLRWWTSQTDSACMLQNPFNDAERARLGTCTSGYSEGGIALPNEGPWDLFIPVRVDEDPTRDPTDFVDLFIGGELIQRVFNDPASTTHVVTHTHFGGVVSYRFEFSSSNSTWDLHQSVETGYARPSVNAVPAASSWGLAAMTLLMLTAGTLVNRYRLGTCGG